jgi:hypothetical protein
MIFLTFVIVTETMLLQTCSYSSTLPPPASILEVYKLQVTWLEW